MSQPGAQVAARLEASTLCRWQGRKRPGYLIAADLQARARKAFPATMRVPCRHERRLQDIRAGRIKRPLCSLNGSSPALDEIKPPMEMING
jgi:hypothetical protein